MNTVPRAMPMDMAHRRRSVWQQVSAATRSPPASAGGFYWDGPAASRPRLVLALDHIRNHILECPHVVDVSHAAASRPPRARPVILLRQMPRTTGLYRPQHSIRRAFGRRHDHVYMRGPTCRSVERPPTKVAVLVNHSLDGVTLNACQHDARSTHEPSGNASEPRVWFTNCAAIVCPAPGVARHPRAVGCPRQKKSQRVGTVDRAGNVGHGE